MRCRAEPRSDSRDLAARSGDEKDDDGEDESGADGDLGHAIDDLFEVVPSVADMGKRPAF
jgi:hypothetical protein